MHQFRDRLQREEETSRKKNIHTCTHAHISRTRDSNKFIMHNSPALYHQRTAIIIIIIYIYFSMIIFAQICVSSQLGHCIVLSFHLKAFLLCAVCWLPLRYFLLLFFFSSSACSICLTVPSISLSLSLPHFRNTSDRRFHMIWKHMYIYRLGICVRLVWCKVSSQIATIVLIWYHINVSQCNI